MHLHRLPALLALFLATTGLSAADDRIEAPSAEDQAKAEKTIRQLFTREYTIKTRPGYNVLAVKLHDQALETKDDPVSRYVLLREASTLAALAGNLDLAEKAVDQMSKLYVVSGPTLKARVYETSAARYVDIESSRILAEHILVTVNEALAADEYEALTKLLKVGNSTAKIAKSVPLISAMQARTKDAETLKVEYEKAKAILDKLKENPDDPGANLAAGKYYSMQKGNWEKGLPLLAKGDDAALKDLATRDLAKPAETAFQIELGEAWLKVPKPESELAQKNLRWRARYWFEQALADATGDTRTKLDAYLKDIPPREGTTVGTRVYLVDLEEFDVKVGHGKLGKNGFMGFSEAGKAGEIPVTVNGRRFGKSLAAHPPTNGESIVKYRLGKTAIDFRAGVAISDSGKDVRTAPIFSILGDGKELWSSKPVRGIRAIQECAVSVKDVEELELRVNCPGNLAYCHAVWLDPYITRGGKAETQPKTPIDDEGAKKFVGVWNEKNVVGTGVDAIYTFANQGGNWTIKVQYLRRNKVVGTAEGKNIKYADGKLTFGLHHVQKVEPHWEDSADVATVDGDKAEIKWKTPTAGGTNHLTRMK